MSNMSPYTTREYPAWAEHMFRILRAISYMLAVLIGVGLVFLYPSSAHYPALINTISGWLFIVPGLVCLLATLRKRWMQEWTALFFLILAVSIYVVISWSRVPYNLSTLAGSCALTWLLMLNLFRSAELTVFLFKAVHGAKLRRGSRRVN